MSKYGEPWVYVETKWQDDDIYAGKQYGELVAKSYGGPVTAARIVACVNACAGMEDPVAEIAQLRDAAHALAMMALQSNRYGDDADYREAVDNILEIFRRSKWVPK
jgi:hypothetical protein